MLPKDQLPRLSDRVVQLSVHRKPEPSKPEPLHEEGEQQVPVDYEPPLVAPGEEEPPGPSNEPDPEQELLLRRARSVVLQRARRHTSSTSSQVQQGDRKWGLPWIPIIHSQFGI
eukprot:sb/3476921/